MTIGIRAPKCSHRLGPLRLLLLSLLLHEGWSDRTKDSSHSGSDTVTACPDSVLTHFSIPFVQQAANLIIHIRLNAQNPNF